MDERAYAEMYEEEERHWWFRGRREVIWALVRRAELPPTPRVLDAGCGTGRNLVEFGGLGVGTGVEASPDAVEFCHRRGLDNVRRGTLESLPFDSETFDVVLACDVLEHIENDEAALSELYRVSAARAHLIVTVPAYKWMWSEHDVYLDHVRRYTLGQLRRRAVSSGWNVVYGTYFHTVLFPLMAGARVVLSPRPGHTDLDRTPAGLNGALTIPVRLEAALIGRGTRLPFGMSLGLVCRKACR